MHMEDPLHPPTIPTGDEDQHSVEPMLLETPQDSYVVKNKPATLKCRAAHALNVRFFFLFYNFRFTVFTTDKKSRFMSSLRKNSSA